MPLPDTQTMRIFGFAAAGHFLFHVLTALYLTLVLVLESRWHQSYDSLIALWTPGALLLGLAAPLAGWLADRWGPAKLMVVYFLGSGGAALLAGLAGGPRELAVCLGLLGLFGAIYHPVATAWLVATARARGKTIGALGLFGGLGSALAALIAGALTALLSWRGAFIVPGLVAVAVGLWLWVVLARGMSVEVDKDRQPEPEPSRGEARRAFLALIVAMPLTTVIYYAFTTMLPKWLEIEVGGLLGSGILGIGATITAVYLLGSGAQLIGGHLADRGAAKAAYVSSYALKALAFAAACTIGGWPVLLPAVLLVLAFDLAAPVEAVLIARFSPGRRRGLAFGLRNGIAIVAAPLGVELVALLYDPATGVTRLLLVLTGLALAILLAALMLPSDRPRLAPLEERTLDD